MKRLLTILLALLWILPASAQSLTGTWLISESMEEDKDEMSSTAVATGELVLSDDGSFRESGQVKMTIGSEEHTFFLTVSFSGGGSWKREGDLLTTQYNPKLAKAAITETDMPGPLKLLIANAMVKEMKKEMSSRKPETSRILSLTDTQLQLQDADGKDPEIETYHRK